MKLQYFLKCSRCVVWVCYRCCWWRWSKWKDKLNRWCFCFYFSFCILYWINTSQTENSYKYSYDISRVSWRRWSYAVWGYSLWIPCWNGQIEQGFTPFQWQTLLSLLLGSICQYPSGLVGSAHRLPRWSLFSSKVACWGYHMRYPAEMVGLSKELPRFNGKPYYPCYWVLFTNTPPIWLGRHIEYPAGACSPRKTAYWSCNPVRCS